LEDIFVQELIGRWYNNNIARTDIDKLLIGTVRRFQGEHVLVDIKKMKGRWRGFFRIRKGKLQIIAEFNFTNKRIGVEVID